jgi:hypothetical protein
LSGFPTRPAPLRDWLLFLFDAFQAKDRAALLEGPQKAAASFAASSKP